MKEHWFQVQYNSTIIKWSINVFVLQIKQIIYVLAPPLLLIIKFNFNHTFQSGVYNYTVILKHYSLAIWPSIVTLTNFKFVKIKFNDIQITFIYLILNCIKLILYLILLCVYMTYFVLIVLLYYEIRYVSKVYCCLCKN